MSGAARVVSFLTLASITRQRDRSKRFLGTKRSCDLIVTPATQRKVLLVLAQADRAVGAGLYAVW